MKGTYIVFEGIVGTGKSTQSKRLYSYLQKKFPEKKIILTREPGGDEIAESVRKVVQGTKFGIAMQPEAEAYLYAASRAQALRSVVKPILDDGGIVISDRSYLSSVAYQGYARDLGMEKVLEINKIAVGNLIPDIIIYIKLEPEKSLQRVFDRKGDKFENENVLFFKKIEKGYEELSCLDSLKEKWHTVDGHGAIEDVSARIREVIRKTLHLFS